MSIDVLPLESAITAYTKEGGRQARKAKVLITVKASPVPSASYGDTVCVAGIDVSTDQYRWVRLYPVPHRHIAENSKFKKYDIVEVPLSPRTSDFRAESYSPDLSSLRTIEHLDGWRRRHQYVAPFVDEWSMCEILRATRDRKLAPSLAVVRPQEVWAIDLRDHPGWDDATVRKMQAHADQGDLFTGDSQAKSILEAPALQGWYKYKCFTPSCKGHRQGILDWEFTALQRSLKGRDIENMKFGIREKFLDTMTSPDRGPLFFVGNQLAHPLTFSVLGVYRSQA